MHLALDNKVVLVTGGTRGIGRSIVRGFLQEGSTVHFCSRTIADVNAAGEIYTQDFTGTKAMGTSVDVADPAKLEEWVNDCAKQSGRIDVIVSNVSSLSMENSPENWSAAFQTDLMGTYNMVKAALPHLEKTKGNIITIASVSGRDVDFTAPGPYGSMKAGLIHYTSQLAHTLASKGIRANTLSPGNIYIEDGVWGEVERQQPEFFKGQLAKNPMGRMGRAEEIADAVLFLASERAAFVSGANLVVDGALCNGVQF